MVEVEFIELSGLEPVKIGGYITGLGKIKPGVTLTKPRNWFYDFL